MTTCKNISITQDPSTSQAENLELVSFIQTVQPSAADNRVNVMMKVSDLPSCQNITLLYTRDTSSVECNRKYKCVLLSDLATSGGCLWRCGCPDDVICNLEIVDSSNALPWQLCEIYTVWTSTASNNLSKEMLRDKIADCWGNNSEVSENDRFER